MPFLEEAEIRRRLERHTAWHRHELTDGPLMLLTEPADKKAALQLSAKHAPPEDAEALQKWWTDPSLVIPRVEEQLATTNFLGDAYPFHCLNLGPNVLAAYISDSRTVYGPTTIWQEPLIDDWATAPPLALREDSFMWQTRLAMTRASVSAAQGRWLTTLCAFGGALDTTACLRSPEKLCLDLLEQPDEVRRAEAEILKAAIQVYERLLPLAQDRWGGAGDSCASGLWCQDRHLMLYSDFSCMVGPEMFREFCLPILQQMAAALDLATYHLDGPEAIRHLDALLTIPNLRAIQWIPGERLGCAVADSLDLCRRILDGGLGIQLVCWRTEELDLIFDKLDPDRIAIFCAENPEKMIARFDRLRAKRKKPR